MTSRVIPPSRHLRQTAEGRIWPALAASAFIHLLLAGAPVTGISPRAAQSDGIALITVRIESRPLPGPDHTAAAHTEEFSGPQPAERKLATSNAMRRETAPTTALELERGAAQSPALPQAPDLTVYTARDLDSYPRPVAPLEFGRPAERAAGFPLAEIRFELLIDEQGFVGDIAFAEPRLSSQLETQLRAAVTSTRFVPARRNGRAVRSRVLLSVNLGQEKRDP